LLVEPENPEDLAQKTLRLYRDAELCRRLGENGPAYVLNYYNRNEIAERFERLLLSSFSASCSLNGKAQVEDPNKELPGKAADLSPTVQSKAED
jgi:hypothetical protein